MAMCFSREDRSTNAPGTPLMWMNSNQATRERVLLDGSSAIRKLTTLLSNSDPAVGDGKDSNPLTQTVNSISS